MAFYEYRHGKRCIELPNSLPCFLHLLHEVSRDVIPNAEDRTYSIHRESIRTLDTYNRPFLRLFVSRHLVYVGHVQGSAVLLPKRICRCLDRDDQYSW